MKGKIEVRIFYVMDCDLIFKIQDRIKQFVAEIEKQTSDIQASENPDLIEMMPKLLKVNFKPMDDIWRAIGKTK